MAARSRSILGATRRIGRASGEPSKIGSADQDARREQASQLNTGSLIQQQRQAAGAAVGGGGGTAAAAPESFERTAADAQQRSTLSGAFGSRAQQKAENLQSRVSLFEEMRGEGAEGRGDYFRERARDLGVDDKGWGNAMNRLGEVDRDRLITPSARAAAQQNPTAAPTAPTAPTEGGSSPLGRYNAELGRFHTGGKNPTAAPAAAAPAAAAPAAAAPAAAAPITPTEPPSALSQLDSILNEPDEDDVVRGADSTLFGAANVINAANAARTPVARMLQNSSVTQMRRGVDLRATAAAASRVGDTAAQIGARGGPGAVQAGVRATQAAQRQVSATQGAQRALDTSRRLKKAGDILMPATRGVGVRGAGAMLGKASPHVAAGQAVYETGALLLDKERREQREREYSDLANKGAASRVFEGAMNPVAVTYGAAANIRETSQVRARAKESGKAADMKREELESRYSNLAQNASTPAERDKYARALARLKKQAR